MAALGLRPVDPLHRDRVRRDRVRRDRVCRDRVCLIPVPGLRWDRHHVRVRDRRPAGGLRWVGCRVRVQERVRVAGRVPVSAVLAPTSVAPVGPRCPAALRDRRRDLLLPPYLAHPHPLTAGHRLCPPAHRLLVRRHGPVRPAGALVPALAELALAAAVVPVWAIWAWVVAAGLD